MSHGPTGGLLSFLGSKLSKRDIQRIKRLSSRPGSAKTAQKRFGAFALTAIGLDLWTLTFLENQGFFH